MRLARFRVDGADRSGYVDDDDHLVAVDVGWNELVARAAESPAGIPSLSTSGRWTLADCELLVPMDPSSRGVFCIGFNYRAHNDEVGDELGDTRTGRPPVFFKLRSSMLAPGGPIVVDPVFSKEMDWEVELGVVIGRSGKNIPIEEVGQYVAGYTIVVDTTARDLQREHGQWFIGKNARSASPIGPWVTTVDEIGFPPVLELSLTVNGVEKQRATSDNMIWRIEEFISLTSQGVDLQVGDIFATGSPPGVGFTRQPPEFLTPGDVLCARIERIGSIEHAVK